MPAARTTPRHTAQSRGRNNNALPTRVSASPSPDPRRAANRRDDRATEQPSNRSTGRPSAITVDRAITRPTLRVGHSLHARRGSLSRAVVGPVKPRGCCFQHLRGRGRSPARPTGLSSRGCGPVSRTFKPGACPRPVDHLDAARAHFAAVQTPAGVQATRSCCAVCSWALSRAGPNGALFHSPFSRLRQVPPSSVSAHRPSLCAVCRGLAS